MAHCKKKYPSFGERIPKVSPQIYEKLVNFPQDIYKETFCLVLVDLYIDFRKRLPKARIFFTVLGPHATRLGRSVARGALHRLRVLI